MVRLLFVLLCSWSAQAAVWEVRAGWSERQEAGFSEWIRTLPLDIFTNRSSPYAGIATDCADAVYALRILYAYEQGLPVTFAGLSESTGQFDHVSSGLPRVRAYINAVSAATNTRTLIQDTYPVAINRQSVRPGTLFLHPLGNQSVPLTYRAGHVYYIQTVFENGMIRYISSTVPIMVRNLMPRVGISFAPMTEEGGYRAWKSPAARSHSQEQFTLGGWRRNGFRDPELWTRWQHAIRARLALRPPSAQEEISAAMETVHGYISERVRVVQRGWTAYQNKYGGRGCMSPADYDSFSTPTRDVKIQTELQTLQEIVERHYGDGSQLRAIFARQRYEALPGVIIDLNDVWNALMTRKALEVSEPEHHPLVRWGLQDQGAWPCPHRRKQYYGAD